MTKRKEWKTPVLTRMVAGAAENQGKNKLDNASADNPKYSS